MGSTESTLSPMEEQQQQPEQQEQQQQEQQQSEEQPEQQQSELQQQQQRNAESRESIATLTATPLPLRQGRPRRQRRATEPANTAAAAAAANVADDPWWWEIENENLILDQVPNVTAVYGDGDSESENANVNTRAVGLAKLRQVCDNVNATLGGESDGDAESRTTTPASAAMQRASAYAAAIGGRSKIDEISERVVRDLAAAAHREQTLDEFKEELRIKRQARQNAVQELRDEIATLRQQLADEQALTRSLRGGGDGDGDGDVDSGGDSGGDASVAVTDVPDGAAALRRVVNVDVDAVDNAKPPTAAGDTDADDVDPMSRGRHANIELANAQLALQLANSENLSLRTELGVVQKQVGTLKEVVACCKQMLALKEEQCTQLKGKLQEIETSFGERELKIMSSNLRQEYERQLGNIRQLRQLYEERQRIALAEQENLQRLVAIKRDELQAEQDKTKNVEEQNQTLLKEIESTNNELAALREECNEHKFEKKALKEEMGAVNTLFSQMVMGFNGKNNLDIDRLTMMLEENRTLLNDMATKEANCSDGATLPKLLFELVEQAAVSVKGSRSPTPMQFLTTTDDDDEDEDDNADDNDHVENENVVVVGDRVASAEGDANEVDAAAGSATVTASAPSQAAETDGCANAPVAVVVSGSGSTPGASEKDNATAAAARTVRRHHRKGAGNRIKLPTTPGAAVVASAAAAEAAASMLKFHEPEVMGKVASAQEIIGYLPKVWKVLMELLSHHKIEQVQFEENGASEDCYKSVETANGPKAELSVSKTYIKLKDLILEKKSLVKETNRLKTLNSHLEYRLNEQEKRLSTVSLELTKTWHLVGKMQRQHRQLHTQEQILRYQLQQKRRLLSELKDELEYCRRKWAAARAKNDESQEQCNDLRREFAQRKLDDACNSAESGYSDSGPPSDEEERAAASAAVAAAVGDGAVGGGGGGVNCRRRHLKEMFEHTRKIKRMQSTSPGRAGAETGEIVLRWNSAPPTCGWGDAGVHGAVCGAGVGDVQTMSSRGAVPKTAHSSRRKHRCQCASGAEEEEGAELPADGEQQTERTSRIQRLEEQCKCLIQQVLETSDNRERLEVQLCRYQDEIAPAQYPVPLDEFINKKRIERMTRASSAPASAGTLTPREEEYTRKRSERLERLEEESRQLMSRIKRTSDRGHYLRCSLDRLRRAPSLEGSFESNTEEEDSKKEEVVAAAATVDADAEVPVPVADEIATDQQILMPTESELATDNVPTASPLTAEEEAYTARRAARLERLEAESKQLVTRLSRNAERGHTFENRLDTLHEQYGGDRQSADAQGTAAAEVETKTETAPTSPTIQQRIGNIEKISSNREQRLLILEEEGKELLSRLSNTSERGTRMINRIAERELQRQARINSDANRDDGANANRTDEKNNATPDGAPSAAAGALMPTLKNVACASIVCDELTDSVLVTTTPSQIATQQGAMPKAPKPAKSQPTAHLNAAVRAEAAKKQTKSERQGDGDVTAGGETLEDLVKRLRELPFPAEAAAKKEEDEVESTSTEPKE